METRRGPRVYRWAEVTVFDRLMYERNQPIFQTWSVTFKEEAGKLYFYHWEIPTDQQQAEQEQAIKLATAKASDFMVPTPKGLELDPYQRAAVEYCITKKASLIGDDMGLGKSIEAIGLINALNQTKSPPHRILIICPADIKLQWRAELRKWLTRNYSIGFAQDGIFPSSDIVIISYHSLHRFKDKLSFYWCLVIADEAQYVAKRTTQMARVLCGHRPNRKEKKAGEEIQAGIQAKIKVAMTGTPIRDRPRDFFQILNWLRPDLFPNRWEFLATYCGGWQLDNKGKKYWRDDLATNQEELQQILRANLMIRRRKKDVLTDLPEKRRSTILIPVTRAVSDKLNNPLKNQRVREWMDGLAAAKAGLELAKCGTAAEYQKAVDDLQQEMDRGASATFELMHDIALAKVPAAIDIISRAIEQTPKVGIIAHHQDVIAQFKEAFPPAVMVTGAQSETERFNNIRAFQEDPSVGPLVGSIKAAKGYTATAASIVYMHERSWLPADVNQAEDRFCRRGQKDRVNVFHLVLESSVDIAQVEALIWKQNQIDSILDQDHRTKEELEPVVPGVGITLSRAYILNNQLTDPTEIQFLYDQASTQLRISRMLVADQLIIQRVLERTPDGRRALLLRELVRTYYHPPS